MRCAQTLRNWCEKMLIINKKCMKKVKFNRPYLGENRKETCPTRTADVSYDALYESIYPQTLRNWSENVTQIKKKCIAKMKFNRPYLGE